MSSKTKYHHQFPSQILIQRSTILPFSAFVYSRKLELLPFQLSCIDNKQENINDFDFLPFKIQLNRNKAIGLSKRLRYIQRTFVLISLLPQLDFAFRFHSFHRFLRMLNFKMFCQRWLRVNIWCLLGIAMKAPH